MSQLTPQDERMLELIERNVSAYEDFMFDLYEREEEAEDPDEELMELLNSVGDCLLEAYTDFHELITYINREETTDA